MKKLLTFLLTISISSVISAQDVRLNWLNAFGSASGETVISMAIDNQENLYITGVFSETVDFDPSDNVVNLISNGDKDVYVAKYDKLGNLIFAFGIGSTQREVAEYIHLDENGNILISGRFHGTMDFDPSIGIASKTSLGMADMYLAKYDANGNFLWVKSMGGPEVDNGFSVTTNSNNEIYLCGYFKGTALFDDNSTQLTSNGHWDIFLAKYSADGVLQYVNSFGDYAADLAMQVKVDANDNLYMLGSFIGIINFDPTNTAPALTSNGINDGFLIKYNSDGEYQWGRNMGGASNDHSYNFDIDQNGNIFVTGGIRSTTASFGAISLVNNGGYDIFLTQLDQDGNFIWAKNYGATANDGGYAVKADNNGNIFVSGIYRDSVDFGDGMLYNVDSSGVFLTKLDVDGNTVWSKSFSGISNEDYGRALQFGQNGEIYLSGYFSGDSMSFNPLNSLDYCNYNGGADGYIAKFVECDFKHKTIIQNLCFGDSILFGGNYYTTTGLYYDTVYNTSSCDSIYTLDLNVLDNQTSISNISGTVVIKDTLITSGSVVLYQVSAINPNTLTIVQMVNIQSNGTFSFDSIPLGNYKIKAIADTALYKNVVPTYYDSTNHWQKATLLSVTSCKDSIDEIKIRLIKFNTIIAYGKIKGEVIANDGTKSSIKLNQIDILALKNNAVVAYTKTDNNGQFELTNLEQGDYLVYAEIPSFGYDTSVLVNVLQDGLAQIEICIDTVNDIISTCRINSIAPNHSFSYEVFPNPFTSSTTIQHSINNEVEFQLFDVAGKLINASNDISNNKIVLYRENLTKGSYFFTLKDTKTNFLKTGKLIIIE